MSDAPTFAIERFTHEGATLVAQESGEGHDLFVLIHGVGMGRSAFAELEGLLDDIGRVVAVDLPGYGETPEPGRVLSMEENADVVAAYLSDLTAGGESPRIVVLGHSMGAQVALEVAARHPHLVDALVLVGPTVEPGARSAVRQLWRLIRDIIPESPRVIAVGAREYLRAGPRLLAKVRAVMVHRPEDTARQVTVPALVIRGERDILVPVEWARQLTEALPDACLREVAEFGHETMIRNAGPTASLIREFLADR
ncbi:alpha-beta hydrolase superfamily lysophospholipase [Microbacterium sp. SLBN-154]|uniref:alpha/beta fold hydrolase n=1 Tax=Microbacterium sp. SLBN-154 TaxID=2768458 RepID=UPI001167FA82|nr:alpha/beta hydrolase [Microbacterium sp. SLBN-154]TQK20570.1 alpha-beta hydrolase superfamily lysophospholipase [Microbacterium sp. SLBN-154]